ncbi:MAG: hypothetical protein ACKN9W_04230 [Methylococcus sp.]
MSKISLLVAALSVSAFVSSAQAETAAAPAAPATAATPATTAAPAAAAKPAKAAKPAAPACQKISKACKDAGFAKGEWKEGTGLGRDCINPVMQGMTSVPGSSKALPTVDPAVIAECKQQNPKYGTGKVGSEPGKGKGNKAKEKAGADAATPAQ